MTPPSLRGVPARLAAHAALLAAGLAAALLVGEGGALLALTLLDGDDEVTARQQAALAGSRVEDAAAPQRVEPPRAIGGDQLTRVLHPFLGFAAQPAPGAYNDYGLLGFPAAPDLRRRPGHVVVLVLGGSVAAGLAKVRGTLAAALSPRMAATPEDVTLVFGAYGGYKQPQQVIALTYVLALGGEVDVVVNLDGFNEVALDQVENAKHEVHPLYPRAWAWLATPTVEVDALADLASVRTARARRQEAAAAFREAAWGGSRLGLLAWRQLDGILASRVAGAERAAASRAPADRRFVTGGPPSPRDRAARLALLVDYWARSSVLLDRLCRGHGIRYFHFLQPNQYDEGSKPLTAAERSAVNEQHPYAEGVRRGYPLLRARGAALRAAGVAFHDLSSVFARETGAVYVDDCCHMNDRGYALVAEAMAAAIRADGGAARP